ncbi:MAG TPA: prepilin-type N-terminal cleavage/methylation domain-containing protein [Gemmatimonadaceae bacterium]|nr:prepilin-type N-terminal cleavage/methylation domain-containing protein [Gemmatimonadaceae bacterium]
MSRSSRSAGGRHPRRPPSPGFTLVEVVVAVALLAVAAIGVASTATFVARLAASARALAAATRATASVVDSLRSAPCSSLAAGSAATAAGTVRWTTTVAGATRQLHAVLTPNSGRVHAPLVEEAIIPCS